MTALKSLGTVILWGVTFALGGGLIGAVVGILAPNYYRSVFYDGQSPEFDPLQVGIGLGVTQGLATGVAIALGVLAVMAWRDIRSGDAESTRDSADAEIRAQPWTRVALWGLATSILVVISSTIAFVLGGIIGQQQLYQTWTDRKLQRISIILDSEDFSNVRADYSSAAQVYLIGSVQKKNVRSALYDQLALAFGTDEADNMIEFVDVAE